jgi:hypothetical protein
MHAPIFNVHHEDFEGGGQITTEPIVVAKGAYHFTGQHAPPTTVEEYDDGKFPPIQFFWTEHPTFELMAVPSAILEILGSDAVNIVWVRFAGLQKRDDGVVTPPRTVITVEAEERKA